MGIKPFVKLREINEVTTEMAGRISHDDLVKYAKDNQGIKQGQQTSFSYCLDKPFNDVRVQVVPVISNDSYRVVIHSLYDLSKVQEFPFDNELFLGHACFEAEALLNDTHEINVIDEPLALVISGMVEMNESFSLDMYLYGATKTMCAFLLPALKSAAEDMAETLESFISDLDSLTGDDEMDTNDFEEDEEDFDVDGQFSGTKKISKDEASDIHIKDMLSDRASYPEVFDIIDHVEESGFVRNIYAFDITVYSYLNKDGQCEINAAFSKSDARKYYDGPIELSEYYKALDIVVHDTDLIAKNFSDEPEYYHVVFSKVFPVDSVEDTFEAYYKAIYDFVDNIHKMATRKAITNQVKALENIKHKFTS